MQSQISLQTNGPGLYEFTDAVRDFAAQTDSGLLTLFVQHTSASLLIQENADPDVQRDLNDWFARMVPDADDPSQSWMRHTYEGPDDMPAHIKAAMLPVSLSIPISSGRLALGTWQGVYLFEHRARPHQRSVVLHIS